MQSDERVVAALSALGSRIALFRFAVSGTLERARNTLASESGPSQARVALGDFAAGLIDPDRFAMISSGSGPLDAVGRAVVERAAEALEAFLRAGDEDFVLDVHAGASPGAAIRARMTTLGSAFGAATLVEMVRRRTYDPVQHGLPLEGHPFEKWTAAERKLAPPLVIRLDGRDLDAFELAPLIDGRVRLVLVVDEPCPPAPLARLISPGVFVAQSGDMRSHRKGDGLRWTRRHRPHERSGSPVRPRSASRIGDVAAHRGHSYARRASAKVAWPPECVAAA